MTDEKRDRGVTPPAEDDGPEMRRACGLCVCEHCGRLYYNHPMAREWLFNGDPWLNRLCNGELVKL